MKTRFSLYFKPLALAAALVMTSSVHGAETTDKSIVKNPWAFDLTAYLWLPSVDGDFSAGRFDKSKDISFIKIVDHLRNFPMAFNGHFDAYYERLGFYLDGTYFGLDFKPALEKGESKGVSLRMGIMDYGVSYRVFGAAASERVSNWDAKTSAPIFDIYTGGRTIWLGNKAEFGRVSASSDASVTAPVIGGRVTVDITPKWYVSADGSVGGFGVDNVSLTTSALGKVGYRTSLFGVPASVEAGYKALSVKVNKPILTTDVMMHGPYIGLTGYW
ncbi:MAG: hypothetical protein NTW85_14130 [Methylococcales bacterium]|nr:hypothetical protein [Methylococcales bacterium]